MTNGLQRSGADWLRKALGTLCVAGFAIPATLPAADPAPATSAATAAKTVPRFGGPSTNGESRVPREGRMPDFHPDNFSLFHAGRDDFGGAPPPFMPAPANNPQFAPTKEDEELFRRKNNWILERPENQTSTEAVQKLFKSGSGDFHLAGTEERKQERTSWMNDYIDASKPAKPASKGTDRERDRDRSRPLDLTDDPKYGKEGVAKPKTEKELFQSAEDKWSMVAEKSSTGPFFDQNSETARAVRADALAETQYQKQQAFQRKEISQMLNLPDEQTLNPRQSFGTLDLGTLGLPAPQDPFSAAADRGTLREAPSGSDGSPFSKGSLGAFNPGQLPSLDSHPGAAPAAISPPPITEGFGPSSHQMFQKPAVLPFPVRPGIITPLQPF